MAAPRIFISHSHRDDAFTMWLATDLRTAGAEVWIDLSNIRYNDFMEGINTALARCEWLVLAQTPNALRSPAVRAEVNAALSLVWQGRIKAVIPVIAEPCDPTLVPPTWSTLHYYDATRSYQQAFAGLLAALGLPTAQPVIKQPAVPVTAQPDYPEQKREKVAAAQASRTPPQTREHTSPDAGTSFLHKVRGALRGIAVKDGLKLIGGRRALLLAALAWLLVVASLSGLAWMYANHSGPFATAMTPAPTAQDSTAQSVCQAYQTQNYKALVALIDPAPVPPNVPGNFDAIAQAVLTTNLQGLDTTAGKVTACEPTKLSVSNASANNMQYAFLMTRAKDQGHHYTCVMIFVHQPNDDWRFSRASDFIGTQE